MPKILLSKNKHFLTFENSRVFDVRSRNKRAFAKVIFYYFLQPSPQKNFLFPTKHVSK